MCLDRQPATFCPQRPGTASTNRSDPKCRRLLPETAANRRSMPWKVCETSAVSTKANLEWPADCWARRGPRVDQRLTGGRVGRLPAGKRRLFADGPVARSPPDRGRGSSNVGMIPVLLAFRVQTEANAAESDAHVTDLKPPHRCTYESKMLRSQNTNLKKYTTDSSTHRCA